MFERWVVALDSVVIEGAVCVAPPLDVVFGTEGYGVPLWDVVMVGVVYLPVVFTLLNLPFWIYLWVSNPCSLIVLERPTSVWVIFGSSTVVVVVVEAAFLGVDGVWEACVERSVLHYVLEHG